MFHCAFIKFAIMTEPKTTHCNQNEYYIAKKQNRSRNSGDVNSWTQSEQETEWKTHTVFEPESNVMYVHNEM